MLDSLANALLSFAFIFLSIGYIKLKKRVEFLESMQRIHTKTINKLLNKIYDLQDLKVE